MLQATTETKLTLLQFVGGPFDGFAQHVSAELNELPKAVALPLDKQAGQLFGFEWDHSNREAIYTLQRGDQLAQYCFRYTRLSTQSSKPKKAS
jgi:hypothetical protein